MIRDSYVKLCFDFNLKEAPDNRNWREIAEITEIYSKEMQNAFNGDTQSCTRAMNLIETVLPKHPDFDVLYCWLGYCRKMVYGNNEARKTYLQGLEKSRLRAELCGMLGKLSFAENNLADAAMWWIRSCAIQSNSGDFQDGFSFLNLATVAKYLNLKNCYIKLWNRDLSIRNHAFTPIAEQERAFMVQQQGNSSILKAIEKLCTEYIKS